MKVLTKKHAIDGRRCDVLIPHSKKGPPFKVFVGGCTEDMTADDLREHFYKYGEVTDVFVPKPFRPFGFVTFLDPEMARNVCEETHVIKGVSVNVSIASPKHHQSKTNQSEQIVPFNVNKNQFESSPTYNRYDIDALNFRGLTIDSSEYIDRSQNADVSYNRFSNDDIRNSIVNHNIWGNFNGGMEQNNFSLNNDCGNSDPYGFISWSHHGNARGPFDQWPSSIDQMHS
jgi:RNA recognition motif-containing protein